MYASASASKSAIYDNWESLVAAAVKKQQLWELFHAQSRSPSIRSEASDSISSFNSNYYLNDPAFDFSIPGSLSESRRVLSKLVLVSDFSPAFDVEDVYLDSAELLGRGTFGSAYKATMKSGLTIVVKILKSASVSEQDFKHHMEFVASFRHENVAPLRAYYSSNDERLMLYDYQGKGSVHSLLHGQTGFNRVDWETRLRIAIGAARGIAKIHTQNGGKLVHGNIKSSNIFLDPQQYGCVSDLGLANMIKTVFLPTDRCYAPEIKNSQNVSKASDVFSFGILLLELLTRKSPIHVPGGHKAVDLVKLTSSAKSKEKAAKVFDADLLEHPAIREQTVKMLQIGMKCVAKSVKKRPEMYEVVRMLEDISKEGLGNPILSVERNKLVFIGDVYPSFDLEDILRASAEVLGKGTFGTSYKAKLEDNTTIRVKRLRGVNVTRKEFQQHIEVIGGVNHQNVAELRAYYFSKDEKLLFYDYYSQESVSALLHGSAGIPLDWETRMKIAVGAARGISHLHTRVGLNLMHGNIKSSNIFINGQKYGVVFDAGMTAVTNAIKKSDMKTPGYCAPEVKDTRKVSQASDVYSFGVFLLELLSGKQCQHTTDGGKIVSLVNLVQSVVDNERTAEVFDVDLVRYRNEEAMEQVLQLAMNCIASLPVLRPRMPDVVKMLEEISGVENESILEDLSGKPYFQSSLEDLLENLLPTLTQ